MKIDTRTANPFHRQVCKSLTPFFAGLQEEMCVRSCPGTAGQHHARLLADGVGARELLHHHAHQPGGENEGEAEGRGREREEE